MALTESGHELFVFLRSFPSLLEQLRLSPAFTATLFPAILKRLGNDMGGAGLWDGIEKYCRLSSTDAIDVLEIYQHRQLSEFELNVARHIMGVLRTLNLEIAQAERFAAIESQFRDNPNRDKQRCYMWSWARTSLLAGLTAQQLTDLITRSESGNEDDLVDGIRVISACIGAANISEERVVSAVEWFRRHAGNGLNASAKHALIQASRAVDGRRVAGTLKTVDMWDVVVACLPIDPKHTGTWSELEHSLVDLIGHDVPEFHQRLCLLAERSGSTLLPIIQSLDSLDYLISMMAVRSWDDLVMELIFSGEIARRQFGIFLFQRLGINAFPQGKLGAVSDEDVRFALQVFILYPAYGEVIPRFLLALASRVQTCDPQTQKEFADELLLQCKNYPGVCLDTLKASKSSSTLVQQSIGAAESYFEALRACKDSPLSAMDVPYLKQIGRFKNRATSRDINAETERRSVFAQVITKVDMLYGDIMRSFHDGALTEPTSLKEHSVQVEFPRIDGIDPEGMVLRRLDALTAIYQLRQKRAAP